MVVGQLADRPTTYEPRGKNLVVDLIRPKDQAREVELELEDERFPEGKLFEVPEDPGLDLEKFTRAYRRGNKR
jgi:hypothetical protein